MKIKWFKIFRYGIIRRLKPGVPVAINLTMKCNLKCPYCSNYIPLNMLPDYKIRTLEELKEFVINFRVKIQFVFNFYLKIKVLKLSGGSPELHPDFVEFVNWALDKGILVQVNTNLTMPEKLIKLKKSCKLMFIATYHHCSDREIFIQNYYYLKQYYKIFVYEIVNTPKEKVLNFSVGRPFMTKKDMKKNSGILSVSPNLRIYTNCFDQIANL